MKSLKKREMCVWDCVWEEIAKIGIFTKSFTQWQGSIDFKTDNHLIKDPNVKIVSAAFQRS